MSRSSTQRTCWLICLSSSFPTSPGPIKPMLMRLGAIYGPDSTACLLPLPRYIDKGGPFNYLNDSARATRPGPGAFGYAHISATARSRGLNGQHLQRAGVHVLKDPTRKAAPAGPLAAALLNRQHCAPPWSCVAVGALLCLVSDCAAHLQGLASAPLTGSSLQGSSYAGSVTSRTKERLQCLCEGARAGVSRQAPPCVLTSAPLCCAARSAHAESALKILHFLGRSPGTAVCHTIYIY